MQIKWRDIWCPPASASDKLWWIPKTWLNKLLMGEENKTLYPMKSRTKEDKPPTIRAMQQMRNPMEKKLLQHGAEEDLVAWPLLCSILRGSALRTESEGRIDRRCAWPAA
jgi:hypothetical protein